MANTTCEKVCLQTISRTETVKIIFVENKSFYAQLLEIYWAQTDLTATFGQFEDRGGHYCLVNCDLDTHQLDIAERPKAVLQALDWFEQPM